MQEGTVHVKPQKYKIRSAALGLSLVYSSDPHSLPIIPSSSIDALSGTLVVSWWQAFDLVAKLLRAEPPGKESWRQVLPRIYNSKKYKYACLC